MRTHVVVLAMLDHDGKFSLTHLPAGVEVHFCDYTQDPPLETLYTRHADGTVQSRGSSALQSTAQPEPHNQENVCP